MAHATVSVRSIMPKHVVRRLDESFPLGLTVSRMAVWKRTLLISSLHSQ